MTNDKLRAGARRVAAAAAGSLAQSLELAGGRERKRLLPPEGRARLRRRAAVLSRLLVRAPLCACAPARSRAVSRDQKRRASCVSSAQVRERARAQRSPAERRLPANTCNKLLAPRAAAQVAWRAHASSTPGSISSVSIASIFSPPNSSNGSLPLPSSSSDGRARGFDRQPASQRPRPARPDAPARFAMPPEPLGATCCPAKSNGCDRTDGRLKPLD